MNTGWTKVEEEADDKMPVEGLAHQPEGHVGEGTLICGFLIDDNEDRERMSGIYERRIILVIRDRHIPGPTSNNHQP